MSVSSDGSRPEVTKILPGGRYEITGNLGRGGQANLFTGLDRVSGQIVAVKTLLPELAQSGEARRLFRAEALAGSAVEHPSIARVLEYLDDGDQAFLVMEFAAGATLSSIIEQSGSLEYRLALTILAQVARGLRALHQADLIHRDVSPGNILWDGQRARLVDFGIAIKIGQPPLTADLLIPGNPEFMAPELALGHNPSAAADIYALGLVFLYAISGVKPFSAAAPEDTAIAHIMQPSPVPPDNLPPTLRQLISLMVNKEPTRRPTHAGVIATCFEDYAVMPE